MHLIHIGKIVASFGLKGQVILKHSLAKKLTFKKGDALFIEMLKDSQVPYFIQEAKAKSNEESYLLFEGVISKEATTKLLQKKVWLTVEEFEKHVDKNAPIGLIGYAVINQRTPIGSVLEVIEQPHQVLLTVRYNNKEAYIPLHQETLLTIDRKKKEIHVSLPDGLLDVYQ